MMPSGVAQPYAACPIAMRPYPRHVTPSTSFSRAIASKQARSLMCSERSEEHTSELQSLMRISYAVFCLKKKPYQITTPYTNDYSHTYTPCHTTSNYAVR